MSTRKSYRQGIFLAFILLFPIGLWLALASGKSNMRLMPYYGPKEPIAAEGGGVDTLYHSIPDFSLIDHQGQSFDRSMLKGKVVVASFMGAGCSTNCPEKAFQLREVQKRLDGYEDLMLISHMAIDAGDTKPLKDFAVEQKAEAGTWFVVGGAEDHLTELALSGYVFPEGEVYLGEEKTIALIDSDGHIRGQYDGTSWAEVKKMIADIKMLIRIKHAPKKSDEDVIQQKR